VDPGTNYHNKEAYKGSGGKFHTFLSLAVGGGKWSHLCYGLSVHEERAPNTHWIWGWIGSRSSLDVVAKKI